MQQPTRRRRTERGAATLLGLAVLAVAMTATVGVARVGDATVRRARADATADLVALAAAVRGAESATAVAEVTGARVVDHDTVAGGAGDGSEPTVVVTVERDGVRARAAATRVSAAVLPGAAGGPVTADPPR